MRVYLAQHGEAKPKEADPERRLTDQGKRDVRMVADFLRSMDLKVEAVWHSGKPRARQTAEILASALTSAQGVVERDGLAPNDPVGPVREVIEQADGDLMVVGHLPFLSRLVGSLVAGSEETEVVSPTYGCVISISRGDRLDWVVSWMIVPELLKS
jgi:phosphohistidine phosphatase